MRTIVWNLVPGGRKDQESYETKRKEGLAYIERLKEAETVLEVKEESDKFIITIDGHGRA